MSRAIRQLDVIRVQIGFMIPDRDIFDYKYLDVDGFFGA
jgi:hypothetical protein